MGSSVIRASKVMLRTFLTGLWLACACAGCHRRTDLPGAVTPYAFCYDTSIATDLVPTHVVVTEPDGGPGSVCMFSKACTSDMDCPQDGRGVPGRCLNVQVSGATVTLDAAASEGRCFAPCDSRPQPCYVNSCVSLPYGSGDVGVCLPAF